MGLWDALLYWLRSLFFGREMEIVVIGACVVTVLVGMMMMMSELLALDYNLMCCVLTRSQCVFSSRTQVCRTQGRRLSLMHSVEGSLRRI